MNIEPIVFVVSVLSGTGIGFAIGGWREWRRHKQHIDLLNSRLQKQKTEYQDTVKRLEEELASSRKGCKAREVHSEAQQAEKIRLIRKRVDGFLDTVKKANEHCWERV